MTFYKKTIIVFAFAAAAIAAFPLSSNAATYIGGDVRADMTLTLDGSPYIVAGDLRIFASQSGQSAGLTIEAGVELRFEKNAGIDLGYSYYSNVYYGWIKVNGTSSQPVLFTANSSEPYAAYWKGIYFTDQTNDAESSFNYAVIEYAGASYGASVYAASANFSFADNEIRYGRGYGIYCDDGSTGMTIARNKFAANQNAPISVLPNGVNLLEGNYGDGRIYVRGGDMTVADALWRLQPLDYELLGNITVRHAQSGQTAVLTIEPGVKLYMRAGTSIFVGYSYYSNVYYGALKAEGTEDKPILFTSASQTPNPGDWGALYFQPQTNGAKTSLSRTIIEYAGASYGASVYAASANFSFADNEIRYGRGYGIYCDDGSTGMTIARNKFAANQNAPISVLPNGVNLLEGNYGDGRIYVRGGDMTVADALWRLQPLDYELLGNITVRHAQSGQTAVLTIEPGVKLYMRAGTSIFVGYSYYSNVYYGALKAEGTEDKPILFTSASQTPNPGDWGALYFQLQTKSAKTSIDRAIIEYAGASYAAGIYLNSAAFPIKNSEIRYGSGHGIYFAGECYSVVGGAGAGNKIYGNAKYGLFQADNQGLPSIIGNEILGNGGSALRVGTNLDVYGNKISGNGRDVIEVYGGTLNKTASWRDESAPYVVLSNITVGGASNGASATLTLEPGVVLKFVSGAGLFLGYTYYSNVYYGALKAVGTSGRPVFFTADSPAPSPGYWSAIYFQDQTNDSATVIDRAVIEYGGASYGANLYVNNASFPVKNSVIRYGSGHGIYIAGTSYSEIGGEGAGNEIYGNAKHGVFQADNQGLPIFIGNKIYDNGGSAMRLGSNLSVSGNIIWGNVRDAIEVYGGTLNLSVAWPNQNAHYAILGNLTIGGASNGGSATLTLEPGVVLKFVPGSGLFVGYTYYSNVYYGGLKAVGTSQEPVVFTSDAAKPAPGDWSGVYYRDQAIDAECVIDNAVIEYAGATYGANVYAASASVTIKNSRIKNGSGFGIYADDSSTGSKIFSNLFENLGSAAISVHPNGSGLTAGNGGTGRIQIRGGSLTVDSLWRRQGMDYEVSGSVSVVGASNGAKTTLTIEPNVYVRFANGAGMTIGGSYYSNVYYGALVANGGADSPIYFTSAKAFPKAGDWSGLNFTQYAKSADTSLEYAVIEYGGYNGSANLTMSEIALKLYRNSFQNSSGAGVTVSGNGADGAKLECNNFKDNSVGVRVINAADPVLKNNNFIANTKWELSVESSNYPVEASGNWWGGSSGPGANDVNGAAFVSPWLEKVSDCVEEPPYNLAPYAPTFPTPSHMAAGVKTNDGTLALSWLGGDPNPWDTVVYDVFLGASADAMEPAAAGLAANSLEVSSLSQGARYFWRVAARDSMGETTSGPVWSFITEGPPPDLIVSSADVNPNSGVFAGQNVSITAYVKNVGLGPLAKPVTVGLAIDGVAYATSAISTALLPGEEAPVSFVWKAQPGAHSATMTADLSNVADESDETNNSMTISLPAPDYPDLYVKDAYLEPANAVQGQQGKIIVVAANKGASVFSDFKISLEIKGALQTFLVKGGLEGGAETSAEFKIEVQSGAIVVVATADSGGAIAESDETNNKLEKIAATVPFPNLVLESVSADVVSPILGQIVEFTVAIGNAGAGSTLKSFYVRLMDGESVADFARVTNFNANGDKALLRLKWRAKAGKSSLFASVDPLNEIDESDESDNISAAGGFDVKVPDFVMEEVSFRPLDPVQGEDVYFTITVKNAGEGACASPPVVSVYVDGSLVSANALSSGLGVGEAKQITNSPPYKISAGPHTYKVAVNENKALTESDYSNNSSEGALPSVLTPDLVISDFTYDPKELVVGKTAHFSAKVANAGGGATRIPFEVVLSLNGFAASSQTIGYIEPQEEFTLYFEWRPSPGDWTAAVAVDAKFAVEESDETNNAIVQVLPRVTRRPVISAQIDGWDGKPVSGVKTISWNASHPDGLTLLPTNIYLLGNAEVPILTNLTASGSEQWDSSSASDGFYRLRAVVFDERGAKGEGYFGPFEIRNSREIKLLVQPRWIQASPLQEAEFALTIKNMQPSADVIKLELENPDGVGSLSIDRNEASAPEWGEAGALIKATESKPGVYKIILKAQSASVPGLGASAEMTLNVGEPFSVSLDPSSARGSLGGYAVYSLKISNKLSTAEFFDAQIGGVPSAWVHVNPLRALISAGQTISIPLSIGPFDATGLYRPEAVVSTGAMQGARSADSSLEVIAEPIISALSPSDGWLSASNKVVVFWRANVPSTGIVYYRLLGSRQWISMDAGGGTWHSAELADLLWDSTYEFYVESESAYGKASSETRKFRIANGVYFTQKEFRYTVRKEAAQRCVVSVSNNDSNAREVKIFIPEAPEDLPVSLYSSETNQGEEIKLLLRGGETTSFDLLIFAQDAKEAVYSFGVELESAGETQTIKDFALIVVNVSETRAEFEIVEVAADPATLKKTLRVNNKADAVYDLAVSLSDELAGKALISPSISHGRLAAGSYAEFSVAPILSADFKPLYGLVKVVGGGFEAQKELSFELDEGDAIYEGSLGDALCGSDLSPVKTTIKESLENYESFDVSFDGGGSYVSFVVDIREPSSYSPTSEEIEAGVGIFEVSDELKIVDGEVSFKFAASVYDDLGRLAKLIIKSAGSAHAHRLSRYFESAAQGAESLYKLFKTAQDDIEGCAASDETKKNLSFENRTAWILDLISSMETPLSTLKTASGALRERLKLFSKDCASGIEKGMFEESSYGSDWFYTNKPRVSTTVPTPSNALPEETASAFAGFHFKPMTAVEPHDLDVFVNDWLVANFRSAVPRGSYYYAINPYRLNYGADAKNEIAFNSYNMNPGQYSSVYDFKLTVVLFDVKRFVAAASQLDADALLCGMAENERRKSGFAVSQASLYPVGAPRPESDVELEFALFNGGSLSGAAAVNILIDKVKVYEGIAFSNGAGRAVIPLRWASGHAGTHLVEIEAVPFGVDGAQIDDFVSFQFSVDETPKVKLRAAVAPENGGGITGGEINCPGKCDAEIFAGSVVSLQASPNAGFEFAGWRGAFVGSNPRADFSITKDANLFADFVCKSVDAPQASSSAVSVKTKTPYKITWSLVETAASYVIEESQYEDFSSALTRETTGTEAEYVREVETDADFYYRVKALSECGESQWSNTVLVKVEALKFYNVSVSLQGEGSVEGDGISCPGKCGKEFVEGSEVSLKAKPADAYEFVSWILPRGETSTANPLAFKVSDDANIAALFACVKPAAPELSVSSASVESGQEYSFSHSSPQWAVGFVLEESDDNSFNAPRIISADAPISRQVAAAAKFYYRMKAVTICAESGYSNVVEVVVSPVVKRRIGVAIEGKGRVSGSGIDCPGVCSIELRDGSRLELLAQAESGYEFTKWGIDAGGAANPLVVASLNRSMTVRATFSPVQPKISADKTEINFGEAVAGGEAKSASAAVSNLGGAALSVWSLMIAPTSLASIYSIASENCLSAPIAPNSTCEINLAYKPSVDGETTAFLLILSNDPQNPSIAVTLTGKGIKKVEKLKIESLAAYPSEGFAPLKTKFSWLISGGLAPLKCSFEANGEPAAEIENCDRSAEEEITIEDAGTYEVKMTVEDFNGSKDFAETRVVAIDPSERDGDVDFEFEGEELDFEGGEIETDENDYEIEAPDFIEADADDEAALEEENADSVDLTTDSQLDKETSPTKVKSGGGCASGGAIWTVWVVIAVAIMLTRRKKLKGV